MIGQKKTVGMLIEKIKEAGALSITKTEFRQGRTTRWGIAWTFTSNMLKGVKAQLGYMNVKKKGEIVKSQNINKLPEITLKEIKQKLLGILDDLKVYIYLLYTIYKNMYFLY
jgi:23S rRNA A1618 N6-methylase RlmF